MADLNTANPCGAPSGRGGGLNKAGAPYSTPVLFGCALCFRKLTQRWTTCKPEVLRALLLVDRPPYADIVVHWLERSASSSTTTNAAAAAAAGEQQHQRATKNSTPTDALLCDYCACFVKERTIRGQHAAPLVVPVPIVATAVYEDDEEDEEMESDEYSGSRSCCSSSPSASEYDDTTPTALPPTTTTAAAVQIRRGRKHGMHMAVEHVLSGGSMPAPSRPHFLRCLAILDQPNHPFWQVQQGDLGDRLSGRKRVRDAEDCVVRWLFEGRQHVFSDAVMAKNMRRWISGGGGGGGGGDAEEGDRISIMAPLPDACRFCCRAAKKKREEAEATAQSYAAALVFEGKMEQALLRMEKEAAESMVESGLVLFCIKCHRVSALSYEYDCALRAWLMLSSVQKKEAQQQAAPVCRAGLAHADAYYARLMTLFYLRRPK